MISGDRFYLDAACERARWQAEGVVRLRFSGETHFEEMIPAMAVAADRIDDKARARAPQLGEVLRFIRSSHDRRLRPHARAYGEGGMGDVSLLLDGSNAIAVDGLVLRESLHRYDGEGLLGSVG